MTNDVSLKAKIRNISKTKGISAQALLQNYLMKHFLYRLSLSEYKDKFVLKGGMLIASIIGIEHRTTMDMDITLMNLPLAEELIKQAFESICNIKVDDGISFKLSRIDSIRDDDKYGGYRVSFCASYGRINAPMSMDISTGDIITPGASKQRFNDGINDDIVFELWSYSIETVLAEKIETILSRGIENTRIRDFYDVFMLLGYDYDKITFDRAFKSTACHRNSYDKIMNYHEIINEIAQNEIMKLRWKDYASQFPYAKGIEFEDTLNAVIQLLSS